MPYSSGIEESSKRRLAQQDERHPNHKIPVSRLMSEQIHTCPCPDAAAKKTTAEKHFLRDTPHMLSCPALIRSHQEQTKQIHRRKINQPYSHTLPFHIFDVGNLFLCHFILAKMHLHHIPQLSCNTDRRICTTDQSCHQRKRKFTDAGYSEQK